MDRDFSQERLQRHDLEQAHAQVMDLFARRTMQEELHGGTEDRETLPDPAVAEGLQLKERAASERLAGLHPADVASLLESLPPEARLIAWGLVQSERRGAVLLETNDAVRRSLLEGMPAEEIAAVVRPLDSDEIADLVAELDEEIGQAVLSRLDRDEQLEVRSMLSYPEGTVGAVMDLDFITVRADASLEAVQRLLRRRKSLPPHTTQLFVVNRKSELLGLLAVQKLLTEEPEVLVSDVLTRDPVFFYTDESVREAVAAFEKYDLISAPVLNRQRHVVGRITVDAVLDEVQERASSDSLRQVGLSEEEDLFAPALQSARHRWPWLALNLLTAFIASRVIDAFEGTIIQLVALAALMPIVASVGGNTGNQSVALMIRGLALDQLGAMRVRTMFSKEFSVATVNGLLWGSVLGVVTLMLYESIPLALVIAAAFLLNLWVAATAGVLVPLLLHRFGRDPVMGSSVILTGLTDSMGFFIFLGLAAVFLL